MADHHARVVALLGDERRVWQGDAECVYQPLRPYARLIERLALMAGPWFRPDAISERWISGAGWTIRLDYRLPGQPATHWIGRSSDYLDLRLLIGVNRLISASGYRFEIVEAGQDCLIACVDGAERARIEQALGRPCVSFDSADEIAFFLATAEQRLAILDGAAVIAEAGALLDQVNDRVNGAAELYELRGRAFYESGQPDQAWIDWARAAAAGRSDIYARMAARDPDSGRAANPADQP
ncbi:MAG TPA: hypothetical protein VD886_18015 [Herpetosiphonaceae bacterium]|nr:hypothetical protein [Herpetosiphonaceae bacterium]